MIWRVLLGAYAVEGMAATVGVVVSVLDGRWVLCGLLVGVVGLACLGVGMTWRCQDGAHVREEG